MNTSASSRRGDHAFYTFSMMYCDMAGLDDGQDFDLMLIVVSSDLLAETFSLCFNFGINVKNRQIGQGRPFREPCWDVSLRIWSDMCPALLIRPSPTCRHKQTCFWSVFAPFGSGNGQKIIGRVRAEGSAPNAADPFLFFISRPGKGRFD